MIYKRITAPAVGAVTLAEVRADLRLERRQISGNGRFRSDHLAGAQSGLPV